jgi:hypothetical protein
MEAGYIPDTSFVLHDLDVQQKEQLCATIVRNWPAQPQDIIMHNQVCGDCHTDTKFISKIRK